MNTTLLTPLEWEDYELIDSGDYQKLERFGKYTVARPEPQAIWDKSLSDRQWDSADAIFKKDKRGEDRGEWIKRSGMVESWDVKYRYKSMNLTMRLGLTSFKHVGIFPEQASNWNFIYDSVCDIKKNISEKPRVLNLFAYTGGATLAACSAGADVTHVDSVKQVVTWSRENMEKSGLNGVRWIVDDALKFVRREVKRGNKYNGIILDPPAYGRGPDGEKWVLEENINELLKLCSELLFDDNCFLILNLYSMGLSALLAQSAVRQLFPQSGEMQFGELYFSDRSEKILPLGVYCRFCK